MIETRDLAVAAGNHQILHDVDLRLMPGQITGLEGYLSAVATGLWAGQNMARLVLGARIRAVASPQQDLDTHGLKVASATLWRCAGAEGIGPAAQPIPAQGFSPARPTPRRGKHLYFLIVILFASSSVSLPET